MGPALERALTKKAPFARRFFTAALGCGSPAGYSLPAVPGFQSWWSWASRRPAPSSISRGAAHTGGGSLEACSTARRYFRRTWALGERSHRRGRCLFRRGLLRLLLGPPQVLYHVPVVHKGAAESPQQAVGPVEQRRPARPRQGPQQIVEERRELKLPLPQLVQPLGPPQGTGHFGGFGPACTVTSPGLGVDAETYPLP